MPKGRGRDRAQVKRDNETRHYFMSNETCDPKAMERFKYVPGQKEKPGQEDDQSKSVIEYLSEKYDIKKPIDLEGK